VAFAFGLSFGAPVLSREIFGARIVPHSRHPKQPNQRQRCRQSMNWLALYP
jgi:hypothetical protein